MRLTNRLLVFKCQTDLNQWSISNILFLQSKSVWLDREEETETVSIFHQCSCFFFLYVIHVLLDILFYQAIFCVFMLRSQQSGWDPNKLVFLSDNISSAFRFLTSNVLIHLKSIYLQIFLSVCDSECLAS